MWAALAAIVAAVGTVVGGLFAAKGSGPLIPQNIEVDVDLWEKNQTLFVLLFLAVVAIVVSRL